MSEEDDFFAKLSLLLFFFDCPSNLETGWTLTANNQQGTEKKHKKKKSERNRRWPPWAAKSYEEVELER
jgi:hypothetical protein